MQAFLLRFSALYAGAAVLMVGCEPSIQDNLQSNVISGGVFYHEAVSGAMLFSDTTADRVELDGYALGQPSGSDVVFETCSDILNYPETKTIPSEYFFYRAYSIECYAAKTFLAGKGFKDSFFSMSFAEVVYDFPVAMTPQIGEVSLSNVHEGKSLKQVFNDMALTQKSEISVSTVMDGASVDYVLLGRRDVDGDGYEDLLVKMTYHLLEGSGRGSQLFALSKTSENTFAEVLWTYK